MSYGVCVSPVCPHMADTSSVPLALPDPADLRASELVPSLLLAVRWCGADFEFSRLIQRSEVLLNEGGGGGVLSSSENLQALLYGFEQSALF